MISPIFPPKSEDETKSVLLELLKHAAEVGLSLEPQGFALSWLSDNTRVIVAKDDEGKATGFGIMAFGRRYFDADMTASVLSAEGPARAEVLQFMRDSCKMLGVGTMFYEARDGDTLGGERAHMMALTV